MKKHYNIAFVGMGSIGKRHLNNVCLYLDSRNDTYSVDLYRSSMDRELPVDVMPKISKQFLCDGDVENKYDIVFVTNPTSLHRQTVLQFAKYTKAFFIEKPVFSEPVENTEEFDAITSYVACPLRYNSVLQFVKNNIDLQDVISVRAISSSYLPDWRPNQDYRQCYSAHASLGGGVDIDLIHEWDYLTWIFGMPTSCYAICDKFSELEIDSNDTALYVAKNDKMTYELHLDYYGRKPQRMLEVYTNHDTLMCDILNGTIKSLVKGETLKFNTERDSFQMSEIRHFFDIIENRIGNDSNVFHANSVLKLTKSII